MKRISTQHSTSNIDQSSISHKKKAVLMRSFRNSIHIQLISSRQNKLDASDDYNPNEQDNAFPRLKTQRSIEKGEEQTNFPNKPSSIRINTDQAGLNPKKSKNIFDNDYVNCLKKGFTHAYQESSKIISSTRDINQFQGPVYFSERPTEPSQNPQFFNQPVTTQEEVYKFHKNPKLLKFKVSLKRQNFNPTQIQKHTSQSGQQNKKASRVLITQLRTQQSKLSHMNYGSLLSEDSGSAKLLPLTKIQSNSQSYSTQIKSRSLKLPKLSEQSNLFKSIKIFQRKQSLLGQIEHHQQLRSKYGEKMFQNLMRDKHKEIERKYDYTMKVHYDRNSEPKEQKFKSKFIKEIEEGKYNTKFQYHERQMPLKLKGRTKTLPRYETILYDD